MIDATALSCLPDGLGRFRLISDVCGQLILGVTVTDTLTEADRVQWNAALQKFPCAA